MVTADYREYVLEQLRRATPASITHRSMFGGVGVYADGVFFAVMDDDVTYFKVDDATRPDYEARGMGPFLPFGDPDRPMASYHRLPAELLEEPETLAGWVDAAVAAARATRRRR